MGYKNIYFNIVLGVLFILLFFISSSNAVFASGKITPTPIPTAKEETPTPAPEIVVEVDGVSNKQHAVDTYEFVGGEFRVIEIDGAETANKSNFAIIDKKTRFLSEWNPEINGEVKDIDNYKNLLFVAGSFTKVDDLDRSYFAIFDIDKKALYETQINPNATVYDILVDGNILYIAGEFTEIDGVERRYIASFYLPQLEMSDWVGNAENPIYKMEIRDGIIYSTNSTGEILEIDKDTSYPITPTINPDENLNADLMINVGDLGFIIPSLGDLLTFVIRIFFVIAGLAALFYMLLGAFAWITSGGDEDSLKVARGKIQAAVVGMILVVAVLSIVWTLEQVIFKRRICMGLSCPLTIPGLITTIED